MLPRVFSVKCQACSLIDQYLIYFWFVLDEGVLTATNLNFKPDFFFCQNNIK